MKLALKNILVNLSQSLSSQCFTATLWVDGHACFEVKDEGFAEPIIYQALATAHIELDTLINDVSQQACVDAGKKSPYQCLDQAIIRLVDEHQLNTKTTHQLRRITFLQGKRLFELAHGLATDQLAIARLKKSTWWSAENKLLNELPFAEALTLLQQHQFRVASFDRNKLAIPPE